MYRLTGAPAPPSCRPHRTPLRSPSPGPLRALLTAQGAGASSRSPQGRRDPRSRAQRPADGRTALHRTRARRGYLPPAPDGPTVNLFNAPDPITLRDAAKQLLAWADHLDSTNE